MKTTHDKTSIITDLALTHGSKETTRVYQYTDVKTGKSELVIEKTITERYPVKHYNRVMGLYNDLTRGGGRTIPSLNDLTK